MLKIVLEYLFGIFGLLSGAFLVFWVIVYAATIDSETIPPKKEQLLALIILGLGLFISVASVSILLT